MKSNTYTELTYENVLSKAMHYCAYQDRCIHDLKEKNIEWRLSDHDFEKLIKKLQEDNFLDENRYAENFVRGKFNQNQWGKNKIKNALYYKGISDVIIEKSIAIIIDEEYEATINKLIEKKLQTLDKHDPEKKIKIYRYLQNKGFEMDTIYELVK